VHTRSIQPIPISVRHMTEYRGHPLLFVGYDLAIARESDEMGFGLKALINIPAHTPITQYEGVLITKQKADSVRSSEGGKTKSGHFCSTSVRAMVINGYSVDATQPGQISPNYTLSGIPFHIDSPYWRGCGGASVINHSNNPNAFLQRDASGDGYGVFAISQRNISKGDFIHVDYKHRFITSTKGNI
jgi:hypothetical protein